MCTMPFDACTEATIVAELFSTIFPSFTLTVILSPLTIPSVCPSLKKSAFNEEVVT